MFSVLLCNSIYQQVCWFRTLASPTLGNVSMVITVSSPVWFCSCPFRIRAAVKVVIPIPDVMTREQVFFTPWNICVCGSRRVCVCVGLLGRCSHNRSRTTIPHGRVSHVNSPSPRNNTTFLATLVLIFLFRADCSVSRACDLQNSGFSSSTGQKFKPHNHAYIVFSAKIDFFQLRSIHSVEYLRPTYTIIIF